MKIMFIRLIPFIGACALSAAANTFDPINTLNASTTVKAAPSNFELALQRCAPGITSAPGAEQAAARLLQGHDLKSATTGTYPAWETWGASATGTYDALLSSLQATCANIRKHSVYGLSSKGRTVAVITLIPKLAPLQDQTTEGQAILKATNAARARGAVCGGQQMAPAGSLRWDQRLASASLQYAQRQAQLNFTGHNDLYNNSTPGDRLKAAGYSGGYGENLAYGTRSAEETVNAWLKSPSHCVNLMQPGHTLMGSGWAQNINSDYGTYWAQAFGQ